MSDSLSSVSWRLNELLQAGKKARAFAKSPWVPSTAPTSGPAFSPIQPRILDAVPEGVQETEVVDLHQLQADDPLQELLEEPVEEMLEEQQQPKLQYTEEAIEQVRRDADAQGYQRGVDEGNAKWAEARRGFLELIDRFRSAQANTAEFHRPLLHLSLHLAQQLVRGELTLSSVAVERLIKGVLEDLDQQGEGPVVVYMNPVDLGNLTTSLEGELSDLDLRSDPQLSQGSLRVSMDDSAIEDLLEHRLHSLSQSLLNIKIQGKPDDETDPRLTNPVPEKAMQATEAVNLDTDTPEQQLALFSPSDAATPEPEQRSEDESNS